jgi:hypothetical protein
MSAIVADHQADGKQKMATRSATIPREESVKEGTTFQISPSGF